MDKLISPLVSYLSLLEMLMEKFVQTCPKS